MFDQDCWPLTVIYCYSNIMMGQQLLANNPRLRSASSVSHSSYAPLTPRAHSAAKCVNKWLRFHQHSCKTCFGYCVFSSNQSLRAHKEINSIPKNPTFQSTYPPCQIPALPPSHLPPLPRMISDCWLLLAPTHFHSDRHWYIVWTHPPLSYRLRLGYD